MVPKLCPVCKIFTSYSNTTLNAHIDQCLFDEPKSTSSTMKLKENPKVIKNIVKPRKMRSMVDVYKTALHCTVEELEMRNGINLSDNSSFPTQEIEFHGKEGEKEQRESDDYVLETGHEDDVDIDFDGTKILKLSVPENGAEDNHGSGKLTKRKVDELVVDKNEQNTSEEKRHKLLRLSPSEKLSSSTPPHCLEMGNNEGENFTVEGDATKYLSDEELGLDDDQGTKDMRFSRTLSSSDTPICSPESCKNMDTSSSKPQDTEYVNQLPLRKRLGLRSGFSNLKETQTPTLFVQPKKTIADAESSGIETKTYDEGPTIEPKLPNSIEVYQGPFPEPEKLTLSPQSIIDDREKMCCKEGIDKTMTEKTNSKIGESDDFLEVEHIPIPVPPGSFLPSQGADIVSEYVQGSSSLTNISRVQSSEDRLDLVDKDPMTLDSPVSATSTVFNPTLTRSHSRSSELLSVKPIANMVGESIEAALPEKGVSPSLRNYHQPCVILKKESVAQIISSPFQESDLLRSSASDHPDSSLTSVPETFNLGHVPMTAPTATFAANPSSSNPVLRLMGKDLIVATKDEDIAPAPQFTSPQSTSFDHQNQHIFTAPLPTASIPQNKDFYQALQVLPPFFMPQVHYPYIYDPSHMNSFNHNQWQGSLSYGGPQFSNHASFPMPASREMVNAVSPAVWNHVPEGSSSVGIHRGMNTCLPAIWNHNVPESSIVGVSSSPVRAHLTSATCFPPRLS